MIVDGAWYNELGSKMTLVRQGHNLTGQYDTAVSGKDSAAGTYKLKGRLSDKTPREGQPIGWVVSWQNKYGNLDSVTTWSGQLQEIDGHEVILTTWLLTSGVEHGDEWESTLIGQDTFYRKKPSPKEMAQKIRMRRPSHPHGRPAG